MPQEAIEKISAISPLAKEAQYHLSIIIPAFNEAKRLPDTLKQIVKFIENQDYSSELIVVDNASSDRTGDILSGFAQRCSFLKCIYESVKGKGAAVRAGVMASKGEFLLISDADLAVPIGELNKLLTPLIQSNVDIAIASRELPGANRYNEPFYRHLIGRCFNRLVRAILLPGLQDTQCGFKCFRHTIAKKIFSSSTVNGWSFDAEILNIAILNGYRILEVPVDWYYRKFSSVNLFRDPLYMLWDIFRIKFNELKGCYSINNRP